MTAEVLDLLHCGDTRRIASYLVQTEDGLALFDCGPASCLPALHAALQARGVELGDVKHLLLSHIHLDHAGAAGSLVRQHPELTVHVSEIGAPHLVDPSRLEASARRLYGDAFDELWGALEPVPERNVRVVGDHVVGLECFPATGHASHQVSYQHEDGTLYNGDAAGVRIAPGRFVFAPTPPPEIDLDAWERTIDEIERRSPRRRRRSARPSRGPPGRPSSAASPGARRGGARRRRRRRSARVPAAAASAARSRRSCAPRHRGRSRAAASVRTRTCPGRCVPRPRRRCRASRPRAGTRPGARRVQAPGSIRGRRPGHRPRERSARGLARVRPRARRTHRRTADVRSPRACSGRRGAARRSPRRGRRAPDARGRASRPLRRGRGGCGRGAGASRRGAPRRARGARRGARAGSSSGRSRRARARPRSRRGRRRCGACRRSGGGRGPRPSWGDRSRVSRTVAAGRGL